MSLVNTLASAPFGGRKPGTEGGRRSTALLAERFAAIGLTPLAAHSGFLVPVPLTRVSTQARLLIQKPVAATQSAFIADDQMVAWLSGHRRELRIDGPMLFVGFGIEAPEYGWHDYAGIDARGKIVVMLLGEPDEAPPGHAFAASAGSFFNGPLLTRHGRWDQKLAVAARQGAAAAIVLHDSAVAGYPFTAVRNTYGSERLNLSNPTIARQEPPGSIWLSEAASRQLLEDAGMTPAQLLIAARTHPGKARSALNTTVRIEATARWHDFISHNVVGRIPAAPTQATNATAPVVLTAHWDHLGRHSAPEAGSGGGVDAPAWFPGAADNASGVAQMLDVAAGLINAPVSREVIIAALTAEESGLLGARHLVAQLLASDQRPLAALNIDIANIFGRARDVEVIGLGLSSLDDALYAAARAQQRTISADYAPLLGRVFRSDQDEFLRQGIPAVWIRGGRQKRNWALSGPQANIRRYLREGYHQRGDTPRDWWVVDAALEDANLIAAITRELAATRVAPVLRQSGNQATRVAR